MEVNQPINAQSEESGAPVAHSCDTAADASASERSYSNAAGGVCVWPEGAAVRDGPAVLQVKVASSVIHTPYRCSVQG